MGGFLLNSFRKCGLFFCELPKIKGGNWRRHIRDMINFGKIRLLEILLPKKSENIRL